MKECCANCYHIQKIKETGEYRCWEEPGVCDHAYILTKQESQKYRCYEYISNEKKFCRDCVYFDEDYCRHKKNSTTDENFIHLFRVYDMRDKCDLFKERNI